MTRADAPAFVAGGTVQAGGGVYLERHADVQILDHCRAADFTYVLTSRQMGKSSLMIRTAERLSAEGIRPVIVDLTEFGAQTNAEQWYKGLLFAVQDQLELRTPVAEWWSTQRDHAVSQRFTRYLREVALVERTERLVIFVDEIDTTLRLSFTDDFFAAIRFLYQNRAADPELHRLSFVLLGVATPGDLIKDAARTPFNVGHRVELTDFTVDEAAPLADHLSVPKPLARDLVGWILQWTGGHPYLTLSVVRSLSESPPGEWTREAVDERIRELFLHAGAETDSNLQFVRDMLTKKAFDREAVLQTYRDVLRGRRVADKELDQVVSWLKLSGIVRSRDGRLQVRNAVYTRVFDERWTREHLQLSVNWRRRLARLATALLVLTILVTLPLAIYAWRQKAEAEYQAQQAQAQRDEAMRQRLLAEQRLAERTAILDSVQQAFDELKKVSPTSAAAISQKFDQDRVQAQNEYAAQAAQLRGERDAALRQLEAATGRPANVPAPAAPVAAPPAPKPSPPIPAPVPGTDEVAAIRRVLRSFEAAYAARDLAALQRIQVLSPAEAAALKETFAGTAAYQVRISSDDVRLSTNGRRATVTAAMDRSIAKRSGVRQDTYVTTFTLEKRGKNWIIVDVSVDMNVR